jgi:DNA-directed RNA polymerase subunit RPC12/RpoP
MVAAKEQDLSKHTDPNNPNAPARLPPGVEPPPPGAANSGKRYEYTFRDPEGDFVRADFYFISHGITSKENDGFIPYIGGAISAEMLFKDYMVLSGDHLEPINKEKLSAEIQKRFGKFSQTLGKMIPRKCTSCGATTEAPMMQASVKCAYCGSCFEVKVERPPPTPAPGYGAPGYGAPAPGYPAQPGYPAPGQPMQPGYPAPGAPPAGTMPCPGCGTVVQTTWKLCPNCGRQLLELCRGCGQPIQQQWKMCPNCGAPHQ